MKALSIVLAAAFVGAVFRPALALDTMLDRAHTQAAFSVMHLALSNVHGVIPLASGSATIGPDGLPSAIDASFNFGVSRRRTIGAMRILRDNYFELAKYPACTFVGKSAKGELDAFTLIGDLTIHGVTKTVRIAVQDDEKHSQMLTAHYVRGPFRFRTNEG